MAKIYCNLISAGKRTLDDVPAKWRAKVEAMLTQKEGQA